MHLGLPWIKSAPRKVVVLEQSCLCFIYGKFFLSKDFPAACATSGKSEEETVRVAWKQDVFHGGILSWRDLQTLQILQTPRGNFFKIKTVNIIHISSNLGRNMTGLSETFPVSTQQEEEQVLEEGGSLILQWCLINKCSTSRLWTTHKNRAKSENSASISACKE